MKKTVSKSVRVYPKTWHEMKIDAARRDISIGDLIALMWAGFSKS